MHDVKHEINVITF